jgi:hypothetical protein
MPKTKISEFSATPANNTDIDSINISEGCAPSGINDAIRELMAQLKDWQSGTSNDPYVVGSSGSLTLNQGTANTVPYLNGSKVVTSGSALTFDGTKLGISSGNIDVVSPSFSGAPVISARFNSSNDRMGFNIANSNGFPFLGYNVNNASASDSGTFDRNGYATRLRLDSGKVVFEISNASGTAGNAITFNTPMTLDASGRLGIGTTSPSRQLDVQVASDGIAASFGKSGGTMQPRLVVKASESASTITIGADYAGATSPALTFETGATERARITAGGDFYVGATTAAGGFVVVKEPVYSGWYTRTNHPTGVPSGYGYADFLFNGSGIGSITQSGTTAVLFNTTSDQRLKENIQDSESASSLIDALKVRQFNWKTDSSHQRYGFVAQELVTVAPEAVHQPVNEEDMMAVDYSKLVPMLVKEVQSLRARVAQLEGN